MDTFLFMAIKCRNEVFREQSSACSARYPGCWKESWAFEFTACLALIYERAKVLSCHETNVFHDLVLVKKKSFSSLIAQRSTNHRRQSQEAFNLESPVCVGGGRKCNGPANGDVILRQWTRKIKLYFAVRNSKRNRTLKNRSCVVSTKILLNSWSTTEHHSQPLRILRQARLWFEAEPRPAANQGQGTTQHSPSSLQNNLFTALARQIWRTERWRSLLNDVIITASNINKKRAKNNEREEHGTKLLRKYIY